MDQGIIQTVKLKFRTRQLQYVLNSMDKEKTKSGPDSAPDFCTNVRYNLLDRHCMECSGGRNYQKKFKKNGFFLPPEPEADSDELNIDEYTFSSIPLRTSNICNELFDCEFRDLVVIDDELATMDLDGANITTVSEPDSSDDENNDKVMTGYYKHFKAVMCIIIVMELEEALELMHLNTSKKQTLIYDFLSI